MTSPTDLTTDNKETQALAVSKINDVVESACGDLERFEGGLKGLLDGVLPDSAPPALRVRIARCFSMVINGDHWLNAMDETKIPWNLLGSYAARSADFKAIWDRVKDLGEQAIKGRRIQAAHNRAVNGTLRPIYQQGKLVGYEPISHDNLLIWLATGDDPAKFREPKPGTSTGSGTSGPIAIQINIVQPHNADKTPTITAEYTET
jgi:hypothetical protein